MFISCFSPGIRSGKKQVAGRPTGTLGTEIKSIHQRYSEVIGAYQHLFTDWFVTKYVGSVLINSEPISADRSAALILYL